MPLPFFSRCLPAMRDDQAADSRAPRKHAPARRNPPSKAIGPRREKFQLSKKFIPALRLDKCRIPGE